MSYLSNFTTEQLASFLSEAQTAYHNLMTGQKVVSINRAGRQVTFNQTNKSELLSYISELQAALEPTSTIRKRTSGKVYF